MSPPAEPLLLALLDELLELADLRSPLRSPGAPLPELPSPPPSEPALSPSPSAEPRASRSLATRSCSFFSVLSKSPSESSSAFSPAFLRSSDVCAPLPLEPVPPGPSVPALPDLPSLPEEESPLPLEPLEPLLELP